jgi:hypothetical protein
MSSKVTILRTVAELGGGERIGFNLTGGTKLMFAGAIAACRKIGGVPFYFETRDHNLIFLHNFTVMPMKGIDNVEMFFQANGFAVVKSGRWDDGSLRKQRVPLTHKLWKERWTIAKVYRQLVPYADFEGDAFKPFSLQQEVRNRGQKLLVRISLDETGRAHLNLGGPEFTFKYCPDFAKYISGGWLEEYTYLLLEPLLREGKIRDLRVGFEVCWKEEDVCNRSSAQEFDVVLTDGKRLFVIECKAGSVISEHVYKLQNCVRNYGGIDARGIMISAFRPHHAVTRRRLDDAPNLASLSGWDVTNELTGLISSSL